MSSPNDEFNRDVNDLQSAKMAMGYALERAQGFQLSIQSLKEQLEQKDHTIRVLQQEIISLQRSVQQSDFEKSSALQKIQSFQDEVNSLLVQLSEREKEGIDIRRKHMEETIALEKQFELERQKLLNEREQQVASLNNSREEEMKRFTLEWNRSMNQLKESNLKKEMEFKQREAKTVEEFQTWKSRIFEEYARKQSQLSLEYSQKEMSLKAVTETQLQRTIEELQTEKDQISQRLIQTSADFQSELERKQQEYVRQLEEQRSHWNLIIETREKSYKEEMFKAAEKIREDYLKKESSLKEQIENISAELYKKSEELLSRESQWQKEKEQTELLMISAPSQSEIEEKRSALSELERQVKALKLQKEYLTQYNRMVQERKKELELHFAAFIDQLAGLRAEQERQRQQTVQEQVSVQYPGSPAPVSKSLFKKTMDFLNQPVF